MAEHESRLLGQTPIDSRSGAAQVIQRRHHEIHAGKEFHIPDVQAVATTTQKWMITTPPGPALAHMIIAVEATGELHALLTEGADRDGTTVVPACNRDRNSNNTPGVVVHRGISGGTTDGNAAMPVINHRSGSTGVGGHTVAGGGLEGINEHILKPSTKYVLAVETFDSVYVTIDLDWYEHVDSEA